MSLNFKKVNIFSSTYNLLTRDQISAAISIPVTIVLPVEEAPETRSTGPQITEVGPFVSGISEPTPPTFEETRDFLGLGLAETLVIEDPESETGGTIRGVYGPGVILVNPEDGLAFVLDDFLDKFDGGETEGGRGNRFGPADGGVGSRRDIVGAPDGGEAAQITSE